MHMSHSCAQHIKHTIVSGSAEKERVLISYGLSEKKNATLQNILVVWISVWIKKHERRCNRTKVMVMLFKIFRRDALIFLWY